MIFVLKCTINPVVKFIANVVKQQLVGVVVSIFLVRPGDEYTPTQFKDGALKISTG